MIQHRSYSGQLFRPKPEIFTSDDNKFIIVATPWGNRAAARKTVEIASDYLSTFFRDPEATSPFPKQADLSENSNAIQVAALLANDSLLKNENKDEYKAGVELFIASIHGEEVAYLQVGFPQVLLVRKDKTPLPIGIHFDLSMENLDKTKSLHPLPDEYIGLTTVPRFHVQSFKRHKDDQLLMISHSWISKKVYQTKSESFTTDSITHALSQENPDQPFWVGVWDLKG
ncbi:MAG: hypothetical protein AB7F59_13665 [Bdellovibrionales bacterium]